MAQQAIYSTDLKGDVTRLSWNLKLLVVVVRVLERLFPALAARLMLEKFVTPRRRKHADYTAQLPANARRLAVFHNLTRLTGWAWGDSGPAVLLIHGWEGHSGRMIPLIQPLLDQGYRVMTLDAPGHGLSPAAQTHLLDVSQAIAAMAEQHGPFYAIIGHSLGAAATAIMLSHEPQHNPHKLVLLSPMSDLQQHFDIFARIAQLSPEHRQRLQEMVARRVGLPFRMLSTTAAVRTLDVPGLVIHDRYDQLIPYQVGVAVARNWHGARLISTEKLGHRLGLSHPSVLDHVLAFLAEPATTCAHHYGHASGY